MGGWWWWGSGGGGGGGGGVVRWWMVGGLVGADSWVVIVQFMSFQFEFEFNHSLIVKFHLKFNSPKIYYSHQNSPPTSPHCYPTPPPPPHTHLNHLP